MEATLTPDAVSEAHVVEGSDGLLLDAQRMAEASGRTAVIDLDSLALSRAFIAERGCSVEARLFAATAGDDYALLAALPPRLNPSTLSLPEGTTITCVGSLEAGGPGIRLRKRARSACRALHQELRAPGLWARVNHAVDEAGSQLAQEAEVASGSGQLAMDSRQSLDRQVERLARELRSAQQPARKRGHFRAASKPVGGPILLGDRLEEPLLPGIHQQPE